MDDQPPVAELVAEPLDQQGAVAGQHVGGLDLLGEVVDQVAGRPLVEAVLAGPGGGLGIREGGELAGEPADRGAELGRAAEGVALPERQPAGHAGRGRHQDPVVGDVLDPPAGGAEREDVADPRLVDHLLVELADPATRALASDEEHAEQAAVGDGAAAGDRQPLGAGTAGEGAGDAVPDDARPQLGELVGGVAAGQQVEGRLERAPGQLGERRGPPEQLEEVVDGPGLERGGGDHLLGEYVERVGGHPQRLDRAGPHPLDRDRGLGEVAAVLGEQHAPGHLADLVAGAADPLQGAGDAGRGLDLDHQVDRAHVDAELEAAGGDDAGEPAALEVVLDQGALLLGDRAVVGLRDHRCGAVGLPGLGHDLGGCRPVGSLEARAVGRDLVEPGGQPLGQPTRVGEDDGRAVLVDQVGDALLDVGPDGVAALRVAGLLVVLIRRGHVLDRDDDLEVPALLGARRDDVDGGGAAEEAGDLLERADRGRQADPLRRPVEQRVEPLERDGEVGAALGAGDRVHLVDDDRLDAAQRLAGLGGEHQEQRLGGRDHDVRGRGGELAAVGRRGVAGADADADLGHVDAEPLGGVADAGERGPEVALDVDRERLQRRDVEDPAATGLLRRLAGEQPVERPQERRQRLAGSGGGHDQRVPARSDRLPRADLGGRRLGERRTEPGAGRLAEPVEWRHLTILPDGTDRPGGQRWLARAGWSSPRAWRPAAISSPIRSQAAVLTQREATIESASGSLIWVSRLSTCSAQWAAAHSTQASATLATSGSSGGRSWSFRVRACNATYSGWAIV